jgi:8-oxo-dGTP diphosphatase
MVLMEPKPIRSLLVAGCVIIKDGKYLLVKEKIPHAYGLWNWPAGKVEEGATIEETAIKEVREETGYDVELVKKVGIFQDNEKEAVKHLFLANIIAGELAFPEDEILDAQWFALGEIKQMKDKLREGWILDGIANL